MTVIERIEQAARELFGPVFLHLTTRPQRLKFARRVRALLAEQEHQELEKVTDPLFDAFWVVYPRQVDRVGTLRAWKALRPSRDLAENIVTAIKAQNASGQLGDDVLYIPYPSSWLRDERWEDEIDHVG
jgi:hypothetical protein